MTISSPGATNVRSGPGTTFTKIGEVQQGQSFEITGKNQVGTWWQFSFNGQPAWISGEMVSANAAAQNVQVIALAAPPTAVPQPAAAAAGSAGARARAANRGAARRPRLPSSRKAARNSAMPTGRISTW